MIAKLCRVQAELKAPKGQRNDFGNYNYRSCEDILEAVKPILAREGLVLTITDEIVMLGNRWYVKATATVTDGEKSVSTTAYAREAESRKGMDDSQITGSSSSYARKYALNGLFCIDDTRDADTMDNRPTEKTEPKQKPKFDKKALIRAMANAAKEIGATKADLKELMMRHYNKVSSTELTDDEVVDMEQHFVEYIAEIKDDDSKLMEGIA